MCWTPTVAEIDRFEKEVLQGRPPPVGEIGLKTIVGLPAPLSQYRRVYAGVIVNMGCIFIPGGRPAPFSDDPAKVDNPCPPSPQPSKVLTGIAVRLTPDGDASLLIRDDGKVPVLQDQGCRIDGYPFWGPLLRCTDPAGWRPDAAALTAMERTLRLPEGAQPLARYARYYAGVTAVDGRRTVKGRLIMDGLYGNVAGFYPITDIALIGPGTEKSGCGVIDLEFDPASGAVSNMRCSVFRP
jgi:hypothetical protein